MAAKRQPASGGVVPLATSGASAAGLIRADNLSKEFRVHTHLEGAWGAVRNLVNREYRTIQAVNSVSFTIGEGELVGYLGPNGAGKSTTIKMLTGILVPSSGTLQVGGLDPSRDRCQHVARLGVVFGQRSNLWWDLPVIESLRLLRHIYRVSKEDHDRSMKEFDDLLGIGEFLSVPVRSLSLGQRMRADLAGALLHNPAILFLDEPTIGLDVVAKERVRHFVQHVNRDRGTTVILTTHDLDDVSRLCKRVMMIDKGSLLFDGPLSTLVERYGGPRRLVVEFAEDYADLGVTGAQVLQRNGRTATYAVPPEGLPGVMSDLSSRYRWADLSLQEPDIESTVRRIYETGLEMRATGPEAS